MKDWHGKVFTCLLVVGEIVVAIFVLYWIVRLVPVAYALTHPVFEWLGELIKHL
jgi:hypothetical protein